MIYLAHIASITILGTITWQDFRTRLISAWLLPAFSMLLLTCEWEMLSATTIAVNALCNLAVGGLLFGMITIWLSIRNGRLIRVMDHYLGWGDVLFLVCLVPVCAPGNFVLLFTVSALLGVFFGIFSQLFPSRKQRTVPLAGIMAIVISTYLLVRMVTHTSLTITQDLPLTSLLLQLQQPI